MVISKKQQQIKRKHKELMLALFMVLICFFTMITFAGIKGFIKQTSPHGNFLVVELSDRITIVGTFSNKWNWEESYEIQSGFVSFVTYIGLESESSAKKWVKLAIALGGYFKDDEESTPRIAKRVDAFPLEIKVRGLSAESVVELLEN